MRRRRSGVFIQIKILSVSIFKKKEEQERTRARLIHYDLVSYMFFHARWDFFGFFFFKAFKFAIGTETE